MGLALIGQLMGLTHVTTTLRESLQNVLRWVLGLVFVGAAVSKLASPNDFYQELQAYKLPLSDSLLHLTALVLPCLELVGGLMLVIGLRLRLALCGIIVLCGIFLVCTGQAWLRGLDISCGCIHLEFLGLGRRAPVAAAILESVGFAFARALLLLGAALFLLYRGPAGRLQPSHG